MYVSTPVNPASRHMASRVAIGSFPVPPTFTARSSATYLGIGETYHASG
jgi:hypothetical protein